MFSGKSNLRILHGRSFATTSWLCIRRKTPSTRGFRLCLRVSSRRSPPFARLEGYLFESANHQANAFRMWSCCSRRVLVLGRNVAVRKFRALAEEKLLHLLSHDFQGVRIERIQTIFVHQHLRVLHIPQCRHASRIHSRGRAGQSLPSRALGRGPAFVRTSRISPCVPAAAPAQSQPVLGASHQAFDSLLARSLRYCKLIRNSSRG